MVLIDSQGVDLMAQYGSTENVEKRYGVSEMVKREATTHDLILGHLALGDFSAESVLLDVGCGNGDFLRHAAKDFPGQAMGLDIVPRDHLAADELVSFAVSEATALPLPDESVDAITALFMLYHVVRPREALAEFQRVLKPGGSLFVATAGEGHKPEQRLLERSVAEYLRVPPPPRFAAPFDHPKAMATLPEYFAVTHHEQQMGEVTIKNADSYLAAVSSMHSYTGGPRQAAWTAGVERIARPIVERTIKRRGYFTDVVERHYYICQKRIVSHDGQPTRSNRSRRSPQTDAIHET